ncbi:MAG: hypothetical protein LCH26_07540 [Proteobacteria bacterium]|nr:hypothetical protein [Pseudomonadota bacterium]
MRIILATAALSLWSMTAYGSDETWRDYFLAPPHTPKAQGDFYQDLSQDMKDKWESLLLSLRTSPHASYIQTHISVLDEVALRRLVKAPADNQRGVVDCAAAVACARFGIPEYMAKDFAYTRSRMGLRETLKECIKAACDRKYNYEALDTRDDEELIAVTQSLWLIHQGENSGIYDRSEFLALYLKENNQTRAVNLLLSWKVRPETLSRVSLPVKLRAIPLRMRNLFLDNILNRVAPMNERRALDILLFLRDYPRDNDLFWKKEPGFSDAHIAWLASGRHGTGSIDYLLKCGELSEERRRELLALPRSSQREARVNEWLREKSAA